MNKKSVIQAKIRKLQKLADSAAKIGSLAEAEAATLAISRLLEKYNLSLFDLADDANKNGFDISIDFFGDIPARSPYGEAWRQHLLATLCQFNYCRTVISGATKRMRVVGTQANALVVIDLFNSLQSVYRYAAKQNGIKKSEISSFLLGCAVGLNFRLEQETKATVMHTTKLVRHYEVAIDAFLAGHTIKNRKARSRKVAGDAFGEGFQTGRNTPTRRTVQQKLWE